MTRCVPPRVTLSPGRTRGRLALALIVGSILLLALHLFLLRDVRVPSVVPDEAGYLGNARWLSGTSPTWVMGDAPYYGFGYSLLLTPLFAVFHEPYSLYRAVIVVNALLVTSLFPLLYLWCRRLLGATERTAVVAALVGALVPAATAYSAVALAEAAVLPLLVAIDASKDDTRIVYDRWEVPAQLRRLGVDSIAIVGGVPELATSDPGPAGPAVTSRSPRAAS